MLDFEPAVAFGKRLPAKYPPRRLAGQHSRIQPAEVSYERSQEERQKAHSKEATKQACLKEAQGIIQGNAKKAGEGLIQEQTEQGVADDHR
jgi:hypothetical protein